MGNDQSAGVDELERELQQLAAAWTTPRARECLYCFVYRMLEFGCRGLVFAQRYRDLRAPRATALERRLGARGGFCDCEIFLNSVEPVSTLLVGARVLPPDEDGVVFEEPAGWPEDFPRCEEVRTGSTRGCTLWKRRSRW
ncbi:DUF2695 domain-containing protein [Nakamurella sp. A5-74]|uniref:DUF2695 domain-containing protein n=1 Tax=Nakamurella sp. A5-74 TaxID=3158264 RepID=A0AAU8DIX4_9ACTN